MDISKIFKVPCHQLSTPAVTFIFQYYMMLISILFLMETVRILLAGSQSEKCLEKTMSKSCQVSSNSGKRQWEEISNYPSQHNLNGQDQFTVKHEACQYLAFNRSSFFHFCKHFLVNCVLGGLTWTPVSSVLQCSFLNTHFFHFPPPKM